jgi:hypothetical protein
VHTKDLTVATDPWRQWQAFAAMATPGLAPQPGAREGAFSFGPFVDAAERFASAARGFLEAAAHSPAEAARTFSDSLREQFTDLLQVPFKADYLCAADTSFGAEAPALGLTREHQQRWQRTAEAWRRMADAQRRLQLLWSDALREGAVAFAARSVPSQPIVASPQIVHRLYDTWIDCAEEAYARLAHGEAYCSALAEFVNAGSQWRQELQASVEQSAKLLDLPTRSEVNTLTRRLQRVEERLRAAAKERAPQKRAPKVAESRARRARRKPKP